ncbi:hypothetical protein, partial [Solirhodobacter olei]|uniref:hypothetical protein n=1 Tax=Solirhodobacter olei TaxID=2493082 RepID=UPI0019D4E03B
GIWKISPEVSKSGEPDRAAAAGLNLLRSLHPGTAAVTADRTWPSAQGYVATSSDTSHEGLRRASGSAGRSAARLHKHQWQEWAVHASRTRLTWARSLPRRRTTASSPK